MRDRREIMTHILMVVAPLVMLAALTAAWFINSNTTGLSALSFASQNTGPGAALHFGTVEKDLRKHDAAAATLQNTVTWGEEERTEDSAITIENMVPGQCEYYLLLADSPVSVSLTNVTYADAAGEPVALPPEGDLPLAQCLGFYLLPLTKEQQEAFDWETEGAVNRSDPTVTLARTGKTGPLKNAALESLPTGAALIPEGQAAAEPLSTGYILAVYCDPVYLQTPEEGAAFTPVNTLEGSVSFSLSFPKEAAA